VHLAPNSPLVLEREAATAAVASALQRARHGHGAALFLVGEAGVGKTTSMQQARRLAADFDVLAGAGDAVEATLPYGVLAQAMGPALALEDGWWPSGDPGPVRRARRFHTVLTMLSTGNAPVLLALDDLHWADSDSLALLSFLCRRIGDLPVAVLASLRPWPTAASDLINGLAQDGAATVERLAPLSEPAAASLLAVHSGRPVRPALAHQAWLLSAGNPLLLRQVAECIRCGEDQPADAGTVPIRLGLPLGRFAGVPAVSLRYVRAASVLGTRFRPELAADMAELDERQFRDALDALYRSGLLRASETDWVEFSHPLFRQALHDDLPGAERSRLHRRAFRLLLGKGLGPDEAAMHARHGRMFGDPAAIEVLDRAGRETVRAGGILDAAVYFQAAVELAGETAGADLLRRSGEVLLAAGSPDRAVSVYERLLGRDDLQGIPQAEALRMLGRALCANGEYAAAEVRFVEAAALAEGEDPALAAEALLDHASMWMLPPPKLLDSASRARKLAGGLSDALRARAAVTWAFAALLCGDATGVAEAEAAVAVAERRPSADRYWHMGTLGTYHHLARFVERFESSERVFRVMVTDAEDPGAVLRTESAMVMQCDGLNRLGRMEESLVLLRRVTGAPELTPPGVASIVALAYAATLQLLGRPEESEAWWHRARRSALAYGEQPTLLWLWHLRGRQRLQQGRLDEACTLYQRVEELKDALGLDEPCAIPWARDAIRAYLAAGRVDRTCRVLDWVAGRSASLPCRWPRIVVATALAALAERDGRAAEADRQFRAALALHDGLPLPLERARTLIDYGAFLRRSRQVVRARRLLAESLVIAEGVHATPLAEEARAELRVAGGRRRRSATPDGLTAQEVRVAQITASGATNAEIARRLVISEKTVESHLRQVYAKLDVRSRRELARVWDARGHADTERTRSATP
jgi:DNA-binding CsgD family transcriptional regulator/tetratricopeptide (TPR) repeat protein